MPKEEEIKKKIYFFLIAPRVSKCTCNEEYETKNFYLTLLKNMLSLLGKTIYDNNLFLLLLSIKMKPKSKYVNKYRRKKANNMLTL